MRFAVFAIAFAHSVTASSSQDTSLRGAAAQQLFTWFGSSSSSSSAAPGEDIVASESDILKAVSGESVESVWKSLVKSLEHSLDEPKLQFAVASCAFVFGILLVIDGEFIFKWIVIAATGILAMLLALSEVSASLGEEYQHNIRTAVGVEVFLVASYTAWKGLDGVMLVVGAMFGFFVAHSAQPLVMLVADEEPTRIHHGIVAAWYSIFVLGCMMAVHAKKYAKFLATVAPLIGGALVASAMAWMAMTASLHGKMDWLVKLVPQLQPGEKAPWYKYLLLLIDTDSKDVGIFANTSFENFSGKWNLDRVLGASVWFVLFILGTIYQYNALERQRPKKTTTTITVVSEPKDADYDLKKPLLKEVKEVKVTEAAPG